MASKQYLIFIILSFLVSLSVSIYFVENRAQSSVFDLVEGNTVRESKLATSQIGQFIDTRVQITKDIANQPTLVSGVMGTSQSQATLKDYLDNLAILGNKESIVLLDVFGDELFSSLKGSKQLNFHAQPWFESISSNKTEEAIFLVKSGNQHKIAIATPTQYNNLAEGVFVTVFSKPLEDLLKSLLSDNNYGAVTLTGSFLNFSSEPDLQAYRQVNQLDIAAIDLRINYFVDEKAIDQVKWLFVKDIALSVLIGLSLSFTLLALIGRQLILNPFKRLEAAQNETREALRSLENLKFAVDQHNIVAQTDISGTITYANEKFSEISGYERNELIGQNHRLVNSGHHHKDFFTQLYKTISKGDVWQGEVCNRTKDNSPYWVNTSVVPLLDSSKKVASYIAISSDITDLVNTSQMLEVARDEANQAAKAKSEFLANMSHEIRTPMNGIIGMLNLVKKTKLSPEQFQRIDVASNSAESLLVLLNDILDLSKIEAGKLALEAIPFDLRKLISESVETLSYMIPKESNIELLLDSSGVNVTRVAGDPGRVRQIMNNLLSNAIKFTKEGDILVSASLKEKDDQRWCLTCSVDDSGIGIPTEKLDSLFDQFTQVDSSTTRKYGGSGLGLSITQRLCYMMGGTITVTSEPGKGSRFTFNILLDKTENRGAAIPDIDIKARRFLIVDGNTMSRSVLRKQIEQWGGIVSEAANSDEAIALCSQIYSKDQQAPFDFALIDQYIPEIGGQALGLKLHEDHRFSSVNLVMMTSMGLRGDARDSADIGFNGYLQKPATPSVLLGALKVILDGGEALNEAEPLVTGHYVQSLDNQDNSTQLFRTKQKLLLVEDTKVNQIVAQAFLSQYGLEAEIAENGLEAIKMLSEQTPENAYSLVFMDCQMPEMDGFEATREIRQGAAGEQNANIPIVAMTANAMKGDKEKCLDAGMDDYIPKPIEETKLRSTLLKWLGESSQHDAIR